MNRIYLYSVLYIITLVIYIFFSFIPSIETVAFFMFTGASIYLVFTHEELPKAKHTKILEVQQYHERRINLYGYAMSAMLILASLLFTSLTLYLNLNIGIASLIIWPVLIFVFYFFNTYLANKAYFVNIFNYLNYRSTIHGDELKELTKYLIDNYEKTFALEVLEEKFVKTYENTMSIPILHETLSNFLEYKSAEANTVSSDEISEVNKNS